MKTLLHAIVVIVFVHMFALVGLLGWLVGTGRVNQERVDQVKAMFALSVEAQQKAEEKAAAEAEALAAAQPPDFGAIASTAEKLAEEQERNEILLRQLERTRQEIKSLNANLHLSRTRMEREREETKEIRDALEKKLADIEGQLNDEGFKKAIAMYEGLPPKQVKKMFMNMVERGKTEQVVDYLDAMQPRIAASVLKEFKSDLEVGQAVQLTEQLRTRGSDLVKQLENVG